MMRAILAPGLAVLAALAACGPGESRRTEVERVIAATRNPGADWPLLLAHCLRSPACDPRRDFGHGEGEASGVSGAVDWHAVTAGKASEGGADYGASLRISVYGVRGRGGEAGRPLSLDELPDNLALTNARRSTLSIEYRTPGGAPEPYGLSFRSAWIQLEDGSLADATIEVTGAAGVLLTAEGGMMPADGPAGMPGLSPVTVHYYRNLRDEPLPALMAALGAGESLSMRVTSPDGTLILADTLYAVGFEDAARTSADAIRDPVIALAIPARCARFKDRPDEFWKIADVTPALLVCDPRTAEQRR